MELTEAEFEEQFGIDAPPTDTKIWIRTSCKWEKIEFIKGIPD
jgi:hypothetical protein